jgi:hypothetical protein
MFLNSHFQCNRIDFSLVARDKSRDEVRVHNVTTAWLDGPGQRYRRGSSYPWGNHTPRCSIFPRFGATCLESRAVLVMSSMISTTGGSPFGPKTRSRKSASASSRLKAVTPQPRLTAVGIGMGSNLNQNWRRSLTHPLLRRI